MLRGKRRFPRGDALRDLGLRRRVGLVDFDGLLKPGLLDFGGRLASRANYDGAKQDRKQKKRDDDNEQRPVEFRGGGVGEFMVVRV